MQMQQHKEQSKKYKQLIFKHSTTYTDSISEINNSQVGNVKDVDEVTSKLNVIDYSKKLWKYIRKFMAVSQRWLK